MLSSSCAYNYGSMDGFFVDSVCWLRRERSCGWVFGCDLWWLVLRDESLLPRALSGSNGWFWRLILGAYCSTG